MAILSTINSSSTKESFASKTMEENIASIAYDMRLQKEFTCTQVNGAHRYDSNGVCIYCGKDNPPLATLKTGNELKTAFLSAMPSGGTITFLGQNDIVDESTYPTKCVLSSDDSYAAVTGYTNSGKTAMMVKCADAFAINLNEDSAGAFSSETKKFTFAGLNNLRSNNVVNASKLFYKSNLSVDELANWRFNNATDMSYAFAGTNIAKLPSAFTSADSDMSKLKTLENAFTAPTLTGDIELNCITSAALTSIASMFFSCNKITSVSFGSNFDGSGILVMTSMLYYASSVSSITLPLKLTSLRIIDTAFSQTAITNAPVIASSSLASARNSFDGCTKLSDITNLSNLDTSNLTDIYNLFGKCTALKDATCLNNWDVSKLTSKSNAFPSTCTAPSWYAA